MTWTPLAAICGGRHQTGVTVWIAQGVTPGGPVTATLASAPQNAVLTVARYSGEHSTDPVALLGAANTNGLDGPCSSGSDGTAYTLPVATTVPGAVVFGAAAMRHRLHDPAAGFTAYGEVVQGSGGSAASVEVLDQTVTSPTALDLAGTFSSSVDWAVIGVEIRPGAAGQ